MADFERTTTVGLGADAAFEILSDPRRLSEYAPTIEHLETEVVDGDPEGDPEPTTTGGETEARFFADRRERMVEWEGPGTAYALSVRIAEGTASTSQVTIRLHTFDEPDGAEIERLLDGTARDIRRLLSGR
jgi:Polyketide cyclase / dehydrase and lipid transport